jgi:ATP dependent DNA ligase-like protein
MPASASKAQVSGLVFFAQMRREPLEVRKATLASILRKSHHGLRLNEPLAHDCGLTVFQQACQLGCEGIVSKRLGSHYRSGRSPDWLKFKNRGLLPLSEKRRRLGRLAHGADWLNTASESRKRTHIYFRMRLIQT